MGQRANIVIIENGARSLYYDHWCANRLDAELFWGPETALAFTRQTEPVSEPEGWLDEVWCEGAAVLNVDRKELLWFGGEDVAYDVRLRRIHNKMMKSLWPNWTLTWASEGIAEIVEYVGLERDFVSDKSEADNRFRKLDEYPEDNDLLLSVIQNERPMVGQIFGDEASLEAGPEQLEFLLDSVSGGHLNWVGDFPCFGLHLDLDRKKLSYWSGRSVGSSILRIPSSWNGWQVSWLRDNFETHLGMIKDCITIPDRSEYELQKEIIEILSNNMDRPKSNPARELAPEVGAESINPWTDITRASAGSVDHKQKILDHFEKALQQETGGEA